VDFSQAGKDGKHRYPSSGVLQGYAAAGAVRDAAANLHGIMICPPDCSKDNFSPYNFIDKQARRGKDLMHG
jgi:hypothetical protein